MGNTTGIRAAMLGLAVCAVAAACGDGGGATDTGPDAEADAEAAGDEGGIEADDGGTEAVEADADGDGDGDGGSDVPEGPGPEFDRYCRGADWRASAVPTVIHQRDREFAGSIRDTPPGTLEGSRFVPEHPFRVRTLRVAFASGSGTARIRLMRTMGHSYPADWPRLDRGDANLLPPVEITVSSARPETWHEIDVSDRNLFLLPRETYVLVYEHLTAAPYLAIEELGPGDSQWGVFVPASGDGGGLGDGNYRMQVAGDYVCGWTEADRWFGRSEALADEETSPQQIAVADLDGDGVDDLLFTVNGRALLRRGDGAGGFADPGVDPFPEAPGANLVAVGDLDNDGDRDAVVATYVTRDGDGDGVDILDGDCNDREAAVRPGAAEILGNRRDDDCDGSADDGADDLDHDGDGASIADGDTDDTLDTVYPGAPELNDQLDNDGDGEIDEDFVTTVHLNDGSGTFTRIPSPDLERRGPASAAALADADGDGFLDLYIGHWWAHYPTGPAVEDQYLEGVGDGTFRDAAGTSGIARPVPLPCYGVRFADVDDDGHQDIWVGNYGGSLNLLFRNRGDGSFAETGDTLGYAQDTVGPLAGTTFGGDFGDLDGDTVLDLVETNISHPRYGVSSDQTRILLGRGAPSWRVDTHRDDLGLHWDEGDINAALGDFDNDTALDLAVASVYSSHFARLYRGLGDGRLDDVTYEAGVVVQLTGRVLWSDLDRDGDLDLLFGDGDGPPWTHLFLNRSGNTRGWIQLLLEGNPANRDAIGARVTLEADGVTQIRDVEEGGGHWNVQESLWVHFGLDDADAVTRLTVRWPDGERETITGAAPRGRYRVVQGSGRAVPVP